MKKLVKSKSIKLNMIMNAVLSMSSFIFPLITFPYVSRILLPAGTGKVSFANSIMSYFVLFAQLGIPTYGIRACARLRDDRDRLSKTVHEIFIINMIMSIAVYIVFLALLFIVPEMRAEKSLFLIESSLIIFSSIGVEWLYKAMEQYAYITVRSLIFKLIALIAMFVLIHKEEDYVIYGAISVFAASASSILNFFNAHKLIRVRPYKKYELRSHLKPVAVFFAMSCATTIYTHLDTVMLGFVKTDVDVGYYNAAVKIKSILVSVVTSLSVVLLPRVSYYIENKKTDEFYRITRKVINFVMLIAVPLMIYFMIYAKEGILLLSGEAYTGSIIPMQIIMPTLLFIGLTNVMGIQILVPMGREKQVLFSEIAGAVVNLVLNSVLIPRFASAGAAVGTLVAEAVVWVVQFVELKDMAKDSYSKIKYYVIVLGISAGVILSLGVKLLSISLIWKLIISAAIFFGAYVLVLTLMREPLVRELESQAAGLFKRFRRKGPAK